MGMSFCLRGVAQMSFGGHIAKEAANKLQKQLQELADEEKLNDGMAEMDIRDDVKVAEKMAMDLESIQSSASAMALEEARAEVKKLQTEKYLLEMAQKQQVQQLLKAVAQMSPNQIKHNTIVANPVVVGAINTMENLDDCTLWWIVQWGNEYLARFKASATKKELDAHESYKTWTQQTKQKKDAGFTASVRSAPASAPGSAQKVTPFVDSD